MLRKNGVGQIDGEGLFSCMDLYKKIEVNPYKKG